MVEPHTVGWRLKKLRREKAEREGRRITQPVAARGSSVPQASLAKYETNGMRPEGDNLLALARYYETTPDYILHGEEDGADSVAGSGYPDGSETPGFFRSMDDALALFRGAGEPGTAQARKRMAWESLTDAAKHFDWPIPDDWYEIPRMIDDGEV